MPLIKLKNPTAKDFKTTYDILGDGAPHPFILHAGEIEGFEKPVAIHIRKHLAHQLASDLRGKGIYEDALKKAYALIDVAGENYAE